MSLARSTVLTLGLAAVLGSAQGPSKTLDPAFASLVLAAHERQRDAAPTPTVHVARRVGFDRRQDSTSSSPIVVTEAPDSTCGFLSASPGNAITCENSGICSWATELSAIICADPANDISFSAKISCVERSEATNTLVCNDVCQGGEFNLLCTNETAPFCRTYVFPSGVTDFRCASTSVAQPQSIDFTYDGQTDRVFTTSTWSDETTSVSSTSSSSSFSKTEESSTTSTTSTPSDIDSPTPDPVPSTNVGAIVGGVVGGVAVLALIGFGVLFMLRRRAAKSAQAGDRNDAHNPGGTHPQPVQQYHYAVSGASPVPAEGWMGPPAQSPLTTPVSGATYDNFSDIHTTRMSKVHSPETTDISQPTIVPGGIHEVDADTMGHHHGGIHEMR